MKKNSKNSVSWIVFLATYPPRKCGLATFSFDLIQGFDTLFAPQEETKVIAMQTEASEVHTGVSVNEGKVIFRISENKVEDYIQAATYINTLDHVKVVSIQHEFGIFGQNDGENILIFLEYIAKPIVVTFHTVLSNPDPLKLKIVQAIAHKVDRLIVMTHASEHILIEKYGISKEKIKMIPHGIHELSYIESLVAKKEIDSRKYPKLVELKHKKVISTFGLLNRGKGIEYAIEALPAIIQAFPDVRYLILGATHPVVLRHEGPVYIQELRKKAQELGVLEYICFFDEYIETKELLTFLQATDIYLSLSQNPDQAVSGTLTYALGAGRAVVSTPFMQAQELVTNEVGKLIKFENSVSISDAVISLFKNEEELKNKSKTAYFRTRGMIWPNIALLYMQEYIALYPQLVLKQKALPPINLSHIRKMTDDFAMFQFAQFTKPDPLSGYTLDDNARSLVCMVWIKDRSSVIELIHIYLGFLEKAAIPGGFENYYDVDRVENHSKNTTENLEDSNARALWAIAEAYAGGLHGEIEERAKQLCMHQLVHHARISSPRAAAFYIKAFSIWLTVAHVPDEVKIILIGHITFYADFLMSILNDNETPEWIWFESAMTYSNAVLPEALFLAHVATGYTHYLAAGIRTLHFLNQNSFKNGMCVPIGQAGWFKKGGVKETFDQQPEEVSALVLCLYTAATVAKNEKYTELMYTAFEWFLGNNILGQVIYSFSTGGCYDGLGNKHINLNQGAESTVSYLLARLVVEKML